MASRRRIIGHVLLYTLYGLVVFVVLLYLTFPYDLLRQRLVASFAQNDVRLTVSRLHLGFPPGVALHHVGLVADLVTLPGAMLQTSILHVRPVWRSLLAGMLHARLEAVLYEGQWLGEIRAQSADEVQVWEIQGRFEDLQLERHPWLHHENVALARGRLAGDVLLTLHETGQMQQGTLNLHAQPLVFGGPESRLPLPREITCDTLQSQMKLTQTQLQIVSLTCRGDDLTIQARGTVNWRRPFQETGLNLQLQIRSETAYKPELDLLGGLIRRRPDRRGTLSFSIRGTVRQPRFGA